MKKLPHRNELMRPTIEAIKMLGGSGSVDEIVEKIISLLGIPDELATQAYASKRGRQDPRTQLEYDLAWVRTYLKQLGILENSERGVWALTGEELKSDLVEFPSTGEPQELRIDWRERIGNYLIDTLSPAAFERLIQRVLRESGFIQVEVTGRTGDGGIDGKGIAKINGILSFRVVFQCKRYRSGVGAAQIRDFRGAMQGRADKGLFMTTGYFTREAIKEATRNGATAIDLIDGERLADKLKELGLGVIIESVERVTVDETWFEAI
jgi:restriction system protein